MPPKTKRAVPTLPMRSTKPGTVNQKSQAQGVQSKKGIIIIIKYHSDIYKLYSANFKQMLRSAKKLNEWRDHNIKLVITLLYTSIYGNSNVCIIHSTLALPHIKMPKTKFLTVET